MMHERACVRALLAIAFVGTTSACYSNVALTRAQLAPGTRVTATLTSSGSESMGNAIGPAATEVEGVVVSASASTIELSLLSVQNRGRISTPWSRELVRFPNDALGDIYVRRLDKARTAIASVGLVVGAITASRHFGLGSGGERSDPTKEPASKLRSGR